MADKTMIEVNGIYAGIQMIMDEIGAIGKNKRNQQQGFNFRGIDDVMNVLHPLMAKAKIFIVPTVEEISREERQTARGGTLIYTIAKVVFRFISTVDGSEIVATVYGEAMDSGDKGLNKAMSIAMKYACFQVFCIPTEEMVDPDKETHEVKAKQPQYPPSFLAACKVAVNGTTLGKLYKENRQAFNDVIKESIDNHNSDLLAACQTIVSYMEVKKQ